MILESDPLAPYAMHPEDSAGRVHPEPPHRYRSPYQRDRDRIVHSSAFRRLSHKTQVFTGEMGDYHRSRLTHTMEVASLARTMARALRVNEDLVEALALAHDIGHPPFGHAGEDLLDERLGGAEGGHGGFNHNAQALRLFELLEVRYVEFPGLNLTLEVLEGQRRRADKTPDGSLRSPTIEAQIVDAADSIAYDAHDADDALELGLLELGELRELALWDEAARRVEDRYASLTPLELRRATIHELLDWQVSDLLGVAQQRLEELDLPSADAARSAPIVATVSRGVAGKKRELERFLFDRVYRHPLVLSHRMEATAALGELFDRCVADPGRIPEHYRQSNPGDEPRAAADYLSGITDRYALEAFRSL
ncbi:Deoxyguanosinetriphosphate triphosphohydrolase [Posidoniimonas corsicana]|uniref:Deoxyguanosinetriphosphate triphosphohydrolase-like protein n=1 Tax=Posidoniimonas corsicana TaxID=1938618 RepID=A0A5C5VFI7_9BACT|nr:dNTP triphosphohydrolase [Posidoniimonas corsicana]TWT36707.1 Deoxyguanosinetriphosphate triphosphohydrolase [Posidoniimonas corsicana]